MPGDAKYEGIIATYFTDLNRDIKPAAFVTPSSAAEVAEVVKTLKATTGPSTVTITGAGQQATPGVSTVRDGLVIHLQNLRCVELKENKIIVPVAAGDKLGKVYELVQAKVLAVVGNRHSSDGIGGDTVQSESFVSAKQLVLSNPWPAL